MLSPMTDPMQPIEAETDSGALCDRFYELATPRDVASLLDVSYSNLTYALYGAPDERRYRTFTVRKRSGGERVINAPIRSTSFLQSKLNAVLQAVHNPKPSAHGFLSGRSIVSNAASHAGKGEILNVDLKDFFPSINFGRVYGMFQGVPYRRARGCRSASTTLYLQGRATARRSYIADHIEHDMCQTRFATAALGEGAPVLVHALCG